MSSADSTATTPESSSAKQLVSARPNPVALETMINVTGARQSAAGGSRDLFSEDTTTVLVFRDGAVIRLDAGVSIGQLLFMKHKKTGSEVVCQVLRKRNYKPTSCYVELQFTEQKPDFWGVAFPESKAGSPEFKLKEHLDAAETTADDQGGAVAPHTETEVEKLRKELDSLRQQFKTLEQQKASEAAPVPVTNSSSPTPSPASQPASDVSPPTIAPQVSSADPSLLSPSADTAAKGPWEKTSKTPPRPIVGMTLPTQKTAADPQSQDPAEALLPKPALDFSKLPQPQADHVHTPAIALPRPNIKLFSLIGLTAIALVAVGFAWWRHSQLAKASQPKPAAPSANVSRQVPMTPKSPAGSAAVTPAQNGAEGPPSSPALTASKRPLPSPSVQTTTSPSPTSAANSTQAYNPTASRSTHLTASAPRSRGAANQSSSKPHSVSKRNESQPSSPTASAPDTSISGSPATDATSIPAKLLKAATPVYPPDAMRHYITGDVRASILVDVTGHVQNVEILSGPQPLRSAAIDALKRYQYSPATQSGHPVSSTLVVTVKFWFNP